VAQLSLPGDVAGRRVPPSRVAKADVESLVAIGDVPEVDPRLDPARADPDRV
jgi:hypothetical protein